MESGGKWSKRKISSEDVISKLKDDGDFDRLRLKIIRRIKENNDLRNNIISMVKQSEALNHPGAENMKPRQLSDAIHQEIGDKVMGHISDGVWEIIRSGDGMKSEITETVQSVYNMLLNPKRKQDGLSSSPSGSMPVQKRVQNNDSVPASACENDVIFSDSDTNEPPGFLLSQRHRDKSHPEEQHREQLPSPMPHHQTSLEKPKCIPDALESDGEELDAPPGFSTIIELKKPCDDTDEDPDVPPGFG